jgi:putative ABC transport system permease protein
VRIRVPLWLRSATRRPAAAVSVLLVIVVAVAAASCGPIVLRAVEQSALTSAVSDAPAGSTDTVIGDQTSASRSLTEATGAVETAADSLSGSGLFRAAVVTAESPFTVAWRAMAAVASAGKASGEARLVARSDGCTAFPVVIGRCPMRDREVLMPAGDIGTGGVRVGDPLVIGAVRPPSIYTVVGGYDPSRSSALLLGSTNPQVGVGQPVGPDLVLTMSGVARQPGPFAVSARAALLPGQLTVDREPAARAAVVTAQQATIAQAASLSFITGLPDLLDRVDAERRAIATLIWVVTAQAVALAWFAAVVVMQLVARVRARDWALGRLRGLPPGPWLSSVFAEPAALLLIGAVAGFGLGVLVCEYVIGRYLFAGTRIEPWRLPVLVAAGLAVAGLAVGLAVASIRPARAPLASVLREGADQPRASRLVVVAEAVVLVATAASIYQLRAAGSLVGVSAGLGLLAPALLATAVGLVAIRLISRLVRRRTRRPARGASGLLAWRPAARIPFELQRNVVVAITVALAVLATQLAALSTRNQRLLADAVVGAGTVLHVQVPAGRDLLQLVRAADPSGTEAMAAAERGTAENGTSRVVAVDADRLARVSTWRSSWAGVPGTQLAALLHPPAPAPVTLRGSRVQVALADILITGGNINSEIVAAPTPSVEIVVADSAGWQQVTMGDLGPGTATTLAGRMDCRQGCRRDEHRRAASRGLRRHTARYHALAAFRHHYGRRRWWQRERRRVGLRIAGHRGGPNRVSGTDIRSCRCARSTAGADRCRRHSRPRRRLPRRDGGNRPR